MLPIWSDELPADVIEGAHCVVTFPFALNS